MPSLAGIRRRKPRATPAAIIDPAIGQIVPNAVSLFGSAIASDGGAVGDLIERRNTELAKADFVGMKAGTAVARNKFLKSLRTTDLDYNGINDAWVDFKKTNFKTIGNTTKQRKAQKEYGMYIRGITPQWDRDVDNIAWAVSADRAKVKVYNSAVSQLQTNPSFDEGLILANDAIEGNSLLTSEQKDMALANAVIETNPQWYLDNVDAEKTKELFALLSSEQKRSLETKARSNISRIRADQQQANKILNEETQKEAFDLMRKNELTDTWVQVNRPNMTATFYGQINKYLIDQAENQKKFDEDLVKFEDEDNRTTFIKLNAANKEKDLNTLQKEVNQLVKSKRMKVTDGEKWTTKINAKRPQVQVDQVVKSDLEAMANDIPLGSVTKDEVLSATNQAWLIEGTIDDNAYDEIRKLIEREHKSYQSTAIKEGVNYGQGQLVTVTQGVVDILIAKQLTGEEVDIETAIEKRELELWNMGQYRKALNDWLTAHPEAESDEIYIESRKLITQYRRPLTEIKTARDDFEQRLTSGEKIPPARIKARFENSIRVADPSGRTGWSEEGIFETELKPRGFTRVGADAEGSKNKTE